MEGVRVLCDGSLVPRSKSIRGTRVAQVEAARFIFLIGDNRYVVLSSCKVTGLPTMFDKVGTEEWSTGNHWRIKYFISLSGFFYRIDYFSLCSCNRGLPGWVGACHSPDYNTAAGGPSGTPTSLSRLLGIAEGCNNDDMTAGGKKVCTSRVERDFAL